MRKFEKAFKMPFRLSDIDWIHDANDNFCIDFVANIDDNTKKMIVEVVNGIRKPKNPALLASYDKKRGTILFSDSKHKEREVMRIRGWGYLTGTGGLNLPYEDAQEIQDSLAEYIVNQLTTLT